MDQKLRILIVDDDQHMTRTLADILSVAGYETVQASSGPEALEKIHAEAFDCILTDVKMPGMNGVEMYRLLRQTQPGLPVVLMTAYAADELIHQGLDEGIVGVFDKPLEMNQLLAFFNSLVRSRLIVIVDDDPAFCRTLDDILSQRAFKVAQFTDPHVDVELMAAEAQVILLDLKFNHTNGLEVLKEIRKSYPSLPVLLVTGYRKEMAEVIQGALEINAYVCLYKPLEIPQLLQMLSELQLKRLRVAMKSELPG